MLKAALAGLVLSVSSFANAGLISVIGDVDAVNIDYRSVNTVLLDNLLGDNTDVLIIGEWATNSRVTGLTNYWNSLSTVNVTTNSVVDITASNLVGFDFLFYMEDAFSTNTATSITTNAINDFINASGDFLYVSQNLSNASSSVSYNSFLTDIGSSIQTSTNYCDNTQTIVSDGLTTGVSTFSIGGCNEVIGGNSLVISQNGVTSVAYEYTEYTNSAQVPEPSTLAIFALGIMGLASRRFKKQ